MTARVRNPYRPGFNQPPEVFAGRADVLDGAHEALEVAAHDARTPRPLALIGPRGVGKTVTLGEIADLAATSLSWPRVHVEVTSRGVLLRELCARLEETGRHLSGLGADRRTGRRTRVTGGVVRAKAFGVGGEVHLATIDSEAESADLAVVLRDTMGVALERGAGLVLTLDELQNASPQELHILGGTLQESVPEDWPLMTAIAALPSLRSSRGRAKLPTYMERAEWHELGDLSARDAIEALTGPAEHAGRPMTSDAADHLARLAGGYPYTVQVAGHYAWRSSHGSASITLHHARAAEPRIRADLVQLFKGRWDDASPRERDYLGAMARVTSENGAPTGGDVAAELGVAVTAASYLRDRLLKKGTIFRDGPGGLHFITPGMGEWIRSL